MLTADRIIVPLDVPTFAAAIALVETLPDVSFWKVGLELFVSSGPEILAELKQRQKRIFLDLKFHDIPNTVAGACRSAAQYGVDLLTIHATAGRRALQDAQAALSEPPLNSPPFEGGAGGVQPPKLIAITLLTSLSSRDLAFDLKVPVELPQFTLEMALMAKECGLAGAVCSPHEAKQIKQLCGQDFLLVCPGVRPHTISVTGDQKRTMTPADAIKSGADYLVIGRPITAAEDPVAAFARICEELGT
ncbi:orotidine-5'-phosphate decarboxylase [Planktothricoides raciborskii]|uniref:Orotidine 5'-phosphate decarboxylase n=1 Tax=Planktothricoides raciborskii GIHE-MW2 TaxID=2792601 RepID=A0AAU8J9H7_9CYAN